MPYIQPDIYLEKLSALLFNELFVAPDITKMHTVLRSHFAQLKKNYIFI